MSDEQMKSPAFRTANKRQRPTNGLGSPTEGAANRAQQECCTTPAASALVPLTGPLPDFDLKNRCNVAGNRRRNASANYLNIIGSHLGIGSRPATPASPTTPQTTQSSRGNRFSRILSRPQSQRSEPSQSEEEKDPDKGLDPMPDTKQGLEIRLNFHLSELDLLYKCVQKFNDMILEHEQKYRDIHQQAQLFNLQIDNSILQLRSLAYGSLQMRKELEPHVAYHRYEVERVFMQMLKVKERLGEEPRLPEVVRTLRTEQEWIRLFRVGGRIS